MGQSTCVLYLGDREKIPFPSDGDSLTIGICPTKREINARRPLEDGGVQRHPPGSGDFRLRPSVPEERGRSSPPAHAKRRRCGAHPRRKEAGE